MKVFFLSVIRQNLYYYNTIIHHLILYCITLYVWILLFFVLTFYASQFLLRFLAIKLFYLLCLIILRCKFFIAVRQIVKKKKWKTRDGMYPLWAGLYVEFVNCQFFFSYTEKKCSAFGKLFQIICISNYWLTRLRNNFKII